MRIEMIDILNNEQKLLYRAVDTLQKAISYNCSNYPPSDLFTVRNRNY